LRRRSGLSFRGADGPNPDKHGNSQAGDDQRSQGIFPAHHNFSSERFYSPMRKTSYTAKRGKS
jgi:hypothetical protein